MGAPNSAQEQAAAIKAAVNGKVLVVATTDTDLLNAPEVHKVLASLEFHDHTCDDCGTTITASAYTPQPFCSACGSEKLTASSTPVQSHYTDDSHLMGVTCHACNHVNILDDRVVHASGSVHCAGCGATCVTAKKSPEDNFGGKKAPPFGKGGKKADKAEDGDDEADDKDDKKAKKGDDKEVDAKKAKKVKSSQDWEFGDKPGQEEVKAGAEFPFGVKADFDEVDDFTTSLDDDVSADATGFDFPEDTSLLDPTATLGGVPPGEMVSAGEEFGFQQDSFSAGQDFPMPEGNPGDEQRVIPNNMMGFSGQTTYDDLPELVNGECIIDACALDDTTKALSFVQAGSKLVAMKGHYAVGTLSVKAAKQNADVMFTDAFAQAIVAKTHELGLRKALKAFTFNPVRVPTVSESTVKASAASAEKSAEQKINAYTDTFAQSLAIAAVGMARSMWKDAPNPLRAAISTEFSRLGHRSPNKAATQVFASAGVDFTRALTAQAIKLQAMSPEMREQWAASLDMIDPNALTASNGPSSKPVSLKSFGITSAADEDDDSDGDEDDEDVDASTTVSASLANRLMRPSNDSTSFRPSQTPALLSPRVTASVTSPEALAVLSGASRLDFGI